MITCGHTIPPKEPHLVDDANVCTTCGSVVCDFCFSKEDCPDEADALAGGLT